MKDLEYKTIYRAGEDEIIINKSKFIGYSKPVESEEDAVAFIEEIRKKHHDATHNVWAYVIGKDSRIQRFSDDGEPSGTAGIPMLEVIKKEGIVDAVVVGTRYFGGVKLGAGGLIRAYTKSAKIGLDAGIIVDMVLNKIIKVRLDYTLYGAFENFLMTNKYIIKDSVFDDAVNIEIYVEAKDMENFTGKIIDLTNNNAEIKEVGEEYIPIKDGKIVKE